MWLLSSVVERRPVKSRVEGSNPSEASNGRNSMKALSIKQPYADLILEGKKTLEIRSWATDHRGRLYICSCKKPYILSLKCGFLLGYVDLVDIRSMQKDDESSACLAYHPGYYAWILKNPIKLESIPIKGKQRIFEIGLDDDFYKM